MREAYCTGITYASVSKRDAGLGDRAESPSQRVQVARDIHDQLGSPLALINLLIDGLQSLTRRACLQDPELHAAIQSVSNQIAEATRQAYSSARSLASKLMPEVVDAIGLVSALEELAYSARLQGLPVQLDVDAQMQPVRPDASFVVYGLAHEAIASAVAGGATNALIVMSQSPPSLLRLVIAHDVPVRSPGNLDSIAAQAETIGGRISSNITASGSSVVLEMPLC